MMIHRVGFSNSVFMRPAAMMQASNSSLHLIQRGGSPLRYRFPFSAPRRTIFALPRTIISLLRLPLAMAGVGAGAAGYTFYKVQEGANELVPDWVKDSFSTAKDWINSVDFKKMDIPDISKLFQSSSGSVPESVTQELKDIPNVLPQMKQAADKFSELSNNNLNGLSQSDHELMVLTKKLIEIKNLLKTVNNNANIRLPSIVVVGSQSSGKSSVLEAIVGHEFLPKGNNMVTRRPIELTLVHNPSSKEEFGEFNQLGLGKIQDFRQIQKTLTDLNLAVSDEECVSSSPIELTITSPNVPNLTLVDLPGYIQIHSKNQPAALKEKISDLCDAYIKAPNIILAVCAADVDLANAEALRASRKADPAMSRTIGVITKMDLVSPERAVAILQNTDYPLKLGYVGIVAKSASKSTGTLRVIDESFFKQNDIFRKSKLTVGVSPLRRRLMEVLEHHLSRGLFKVVDAVQAELDDARYQFKVQYNDRKVSAESYVAETMDALKTSFRQFTQEYAKAQVREQIRSILEQKILGICEELFWNDASIALLPKSCQDTAAEARLDIAATALTKSGVGRSSVQVVVDTLLENMERILTAEQWIHHPETRNQILQFSNDIIRSRISSTVDQVENTIKPLKFEVECSDTEWKEGVRRATLLLESTLSDSQKVLQTIKASFGRRKLRNAMSRIQKQERESELPSSDNVNFLAGLDPKLVDAGRDALALKRHIWHLQARLSQLRSRPCSQVNNKACCPEAFLEAVAEKLTYGAVMFINVDLVNEFYFQLPREIDNKLYYDLSRQQIRKFALENPSISRHIETQEKKETLELAMEKLRSLSQK